MPVISMFYGIIIYMYYEIGAKHKKPHIHAKYQNQSVIISLDGEVLEGEIPFKKMKMVQVWVDIHQEELLADWDLLSNQQEYFKIDPLK